MQNWIRPSGLLAIALSIVLAGASQAVVAPEMQLGESLSEQQREALGTLALADAPVREAILEASLHPQTIREIAGIAERSSASFRARLEQVPRSKQKDIWELVRHPELIDALVLGGRPSRGSIDAIVADYPESVREIARRAAQHDFNLLNDIAHLRGDAERETAGVLAALSFESQASFEVLIERPDIMTLLATHPELSAKLGALYRGSPQLARETLDRHHLKMVEENELAVTAWREMIEEDPEARDELVESAERFADEEGYESPSEATALIEPSQPYYYHHPYPYWFGTPYWHLAVHWYPHHAHWGFGYYADGSLWVFGLPSAAFSYWHFGYPSYYGHYPSLHRRWSHHRGDHHYRRHASRDHDRGSYRRDVPRRKHSDDRRDSHDVESVSRRHDPSGGVRRERRPGNYPDMSARRGREARETTPRREQRKQVAERGTQRVRQKEEKSGTRRVGDKKSRSRTVHADKGGARRSHKAKGRAHGSQRAKSSGQRRAGGRMARR